MKLGQLIEYNKEKIFVQKLRRKQAVCNLVFSIALNLGYNENKLYETLDHWSRDMLHVNFPEKCLGLLSAPHFVYDFSRIKFLVLYSTK